MAQSETKLESDLIRRAQAGEPRAFQQIALHHSERLYRCALTLCHDRQLAEDILQETLLEAWRSIGRFDGRCHLSTWLYGILRHRFLKAGRKTTHPALRAFSIDESASIPAHDNDPSRVAELAEDAAILRQAVATLAEEHRPVIELRFFGHATLEEIATVLGIPLGTVKSRLHNGLERLRQMDLNVNLFSKSGESPERLS